MEKLTSKIYGEFSNSKREKTKIKYKIQLIYDSKLKYDVIGRKIREKDEYKTALIAGSKAFYSANSKMIVDIQEAISPYSLNKVSLSSTPWMRKSI